MIANSTPTKGESQSETAASECAAAADTPAWRSTRRAGFASLAALVALSIGALIFVTFAYSLPDRSTDRSRSAALIAAKEGTQAMLSYTPGTVASDIAAAKTHLTGEFLTYYDEFSGQFVEPAAKMQQVSNKAVVVRAAVAEIATDTAKVLVFINQESTSKAKPDATTTASSVLVSLTKTDEKWLISAFDPNAAG